MVRLAWMMPPRGRKKPLDGVEKAPRAGGKNTTRWVTFMHVSEIPIVQWQIWLPSNLSEP